MNGSRTQFYITTLTWVFVFSLLAYGGFAYASSTQTASIFNPVSAFLGIGTNDEASDLKPAPQPEQGQTFDADAFFNATPSDFLGAPTPSDPFTTVAPMQAQPAGAQNSQRTSLSGQSPVFACAPDVVMPGEEILLTWLCRDESHKTIGNGFTTQGAVMGITRYSVTTDETLSLECLSDTDEQNTVAQCAIDVVHPAVAVIATPSRAHRGGGVQISWRTKDTRSCVLTSRDHPQFERSGKRGSVASPTLFEDTEFRLVCETLTGAVETRTLQVSVH